MVQPLNWSDKNIPNADFHQIGHFGLGLGRLDLVVEQSVYVSVCVFVCVCVCLSLFMQYILRPIFPPLPEVGCPKFLDIQNPWGKLLERMGLRIEHFCFEVV